MDSLLTGCGYEHYSHPHILKGVCDVQGFDILLLSLIGIACLVIFILWKVGVFE